MKKNHSIEFLRILFSIIIVCFHITHSNIMPYVGENEIYLKFQEMTHWASAIVECFLILGGFMLYTSYSRNPGKSYIEYAITRFMRLWPVYAFYIICTLLLGDSIGEDTLLDLFLLRCTGISLSYIGIIWYIAPFFWSSLLIYAILKYIKPGVAGILLSMIAYWGYAINLNTLDGIFGREIAYSFVSLGMLRVAAGISLGVLISMGMEAFQKRFPTIRPSSVSVMLASALELGSLGLLLKLFVISNQPFQNMFSVIVLFTVLLICFVSHQGILSRFLNKPVFSSLGKYAYSIYVMQQVSFIILEKTFWKYTNFVTTHEYITLLISTCFSIAVGILTYYLIEKPSSFVFRKWLVAHSE